MASDTPKKIGKYDILDVLGRGGMGIVYKATDPGIGRLVAIKMMTVGFANDPELLKRFYREAQSAGKLQHPNIVTIYDLGDQDGNPFIVMEFLGGESLDSIIASHRSLSIDQKLHIVIQICNALNFAHQHNVIHRDIKPGNVMVLKDLTVKIVDFGIARIGNENVTRPGQLIGSVPYMSPEQVKDRAYVDSRADIFSVGVLLYQLLTFVLPFDGKDMGAILLKIIHEPYPPLQSLLRSYPSELDRIIALALAKNPDERYPTVDRLAFDLIRVQDEMKRDAVAEYLKAVDSLVASQQWNQAKAEILRVLDIDPWNVRARELLSSVEQRLQLQQRSQEARDLRLQAEQAIRHDELADALRFLDHAVELDTNNSELIGLRNSVAERKARADQLAALLQRAESEREAGELEDCRRAVVEALVLDPDNREAQALKAIITREIEELNKLRQVQGFLDEARKRIASRSFTGALEVLKLAEELAPSAPGIKELAELATSGQEQERRRKQLEALNAEIEEALNRDNFVLACAKADEGLRLFPEDRSLLKLKKLAEKQRQASEKRAYVEKQIATARQFLDSPDYPDRALVPIEEALKRYPQEPALVSMLAVVKESLARRREEQRKAECIQRAKNCIRRKEYAEAIATLEAARKEIVTADLDDLDQLIQFAEEEAASYARRQRITAVSEKTAQLISADEFQSAIDLLEATLLEIEDEELEIVLENARRRQREFNQAVQETVSSGERLLRNDRYSEAVRFLEAQSERYGKHPEVGALLERARRELKRVQSFSSAKENVREALSKNDFLSAGATLKQFLDEFGDTPDAKLLQQEIEVTRSKAATVAMEKALPDVRMLLKVRSFDSASGILESLEQWSKFAEPAVIEEYESLLAFTRRTQTERAANEAARRLNQVRIADQATASRLEPSAEGMEIGDEGATDAMSRSQLLAVLVQVTQIGDHYQNNEDVRTAIQNFKQQLTSRIEALDRPETETQLGIPPVLASSTSVSTPAPPPAVTVIAPTAPQTSSGNAKVEPEEIGFELAESRDREQRVQAIEKQARALAESDKFEQALRALDEGLQQFPESQLLEVRESISADRRRSEQLSEARRLLGAGDFSGALALVETGLRTAPGDEAFAALKSQIASEQARRRSEEITAAINEARVRIREGRLVSANELLRRSAARFPDDKTIAGLLRTAEEQLRKEFEVNTVRLRAESLVSEGREEDAVALLETRSGEPSLEDLLAEARRALNARRQEQLLNRATALQGEGRYSEALELVQNAIRQHGMSTAANELERALQQQIASQQRQRVRAADRDTLLSIEREIPGTKKSKLKKLVARGERVAAKYPADEEIAAVLLRIRERVDSELLPPPLPAPEPSPAGVKRAPVLAAIAGLLILGAAGIIVLPRFLRVRTVVIEVRSNPPGADVRIGNRSCLTTNCRFDLSPGPYKIEARLTGYEPIQKDVMVDRSAAMATIDLTLQPLPPPLPPPGVPHGTLVVQSGEPDALVLVDGVSRGFTDSQGSFRFELEAKRHQVRVEKNGFRTPREQRVLIAKDVSQQLTFKLQPSEPKPEPNSGQTVTSAGQQVPKTLPATVGTAVAPPVEASDWNGASKGGESDLETYLAKYPNGSHAAEAQSKLQELIWTRTNQNDLRALQSYLESYPNAAHSAEASRRIETISWNQLDKRNRRALVDFAAKFPTGTHRDDAQSILKQMDLADADKKAIQAALDKFNAAWQDQQPRELKEIWPSVTSKYLEQLHPPAGYKVVFTLIATGDPEISGDTALVPCNLKSDTTEPSRQTITKQKSVRAQFIRTGNGWLISDAFGQ